LLGLIPLWLSAIVIFRDLIIASGVLFYSFVIEPFEGEPTLISKINTFLELLFVLMVLSASAFMWPNQLTITVIGSAVFVTVVISGIDYIISWLRRVKTHDIHV
jgi:cardiolipin synthase